MKKIDLTPIYESLLKRIQDGSLVDADGKLPPERDLAKLFGLARNTLRPVLKQLEMEGYLTRKTKTGTQVTDQCQCSIYYLLPCPDFLEAKYAEASGFSLRLLSKVSQAVYNRGATLRLLYATDDNDPNHVNVRNLSELKPGGRVIVNSSWYFPLFPLLSQRGVHAVFIGPTTEETPKLLASEYRDTFHFLLLDREREIQNLYHYLQTQGYRHIGMAGTNLVEDHPLTLGFRKACRDAGQDQDLLFSLPLDKRLSRGTFTLKSRFLQHCLDSHRDLDALILREDMIPNLMREYNNQGCMESYAHPQLAYVSVFGELFPSQPQVPTSLTSMTETAKLAVDLLMRPTWKPNVDYLPYHLITG